MHTSHSKLRTVHFFFCWLFTVVVGSTFPAIVSEDFEFVVLFMAVAAIVSTPFLIFFLIIVHIKLKRKPSVRDLHLYVFLIHFFGSIATVLALMLIFTYDIRNDYGSFVLLVSSYFLIDSLLFHSCIAFLYPKQRVLDSDKNSH